MAEQHMVFGAGLGSYEASANLIEDGGTYPHNLFLETLAETGIIGFLLFCTAIVAAIVGVLARVGRLSFFQAAIWLGFVVETMVEISVSSTITDHFLAFSLGLSAGLIALADRMRAAAAPASL
jgi:O-antigen ligase